VDFYIYFILTVVYAGMLIRGWFITRKQPTPLYAVLLLLVTLALLYDNAVLALGKTIGEGETLINLNAVRYWLHAFCTPLLIPVGYYILRKERFRLAQKGWAAATAWLITLALVVYQSIFAVKETQHLKAVTEYGVLHYTPTGANGSGVMIITVTAILFAVSLALLFRRRWWRLAVSIVVTAGGMAASSLLDSKAILNVFEWVFMGGLWLTLNRRRPQKPY